jgi:hypothetical protein
MQRNDRAGGRPMSSFGRGIKYWADEENLLGRLLGLLEGMGADQL